MRCLLLLLLASLTTHPAASQGAIDIPLPDHPRPDFQRQEWINLNGAWDFRFDDADVLPPGMAFPSVITVPFSWGAPLSHVPDEGNVGWYRRTIEIPSDWGNRRVFLVVGAADWVTTAWVDGERLGTHRGGYTPFEFEVTPHVEPGKMYELLLRVDDTPHDFKLEGKQGYGAARGIWQTIYLEARGGFPVGRVGITPDLGAEEARFEVVLQDPATEGMSLSVAVSGRDGQRSIERSIRPGEEAIEFVLDMHDAVLWSLDDPHLYDVTLNVTGAGSPDVVRTYFGMREFSVVDLPGTGDPYVALNGEPVYLKMALDQAYHPEGFYTFPSDEFVRDEILRSRRIGLNAMRVHVKVGVPRKLYWADRLGMLIMADVPNSWGEPTADMRAEVEVALTGMIRRDYNHPSIFAWVPFNETWGLRTDVGGEDVYTDETKAWVVSVVERAKSLDPTRLVEDNSVCCGVGHTQTDLNSWHIYTTGYDMPAHLDRVSDATYSGSTWNYEAGFRQARQPLINSEFGNVWGYEGSTGDVDWSWDYHLFMNEFRRHPRIAGWLYTEHHDVVNEWNGYWRYDRSEKTTGLNELADGMSLRDLHAPVYVAVGERGTLASEVAAGEDVAVPLWASFMTGSEALSEELLLTAELYAYDRIGRRRPYGRQSRLERYRPWHAGALDSLTVHMPEDPGLAVLTVTVSDGPTVLHRNFTTFVVTGDRQDVMTTADGHAAHLSSVRPNEVADAAWTLRRWEVLDGLKVNGAGSGFFEYHVPWPDGVQADDVVRASFLFEASAKQLYGKDVEDRGTMEGDYMRGGGAHDPSLNPNAYPMTDEDVFPSAVTVRVGDSVAGRYELADDPADHRGILSWHAQPHDHRLREAGSYGYLVNAPLPRTEIEAAAADGELIVRLEVDTALPHGLAVYGARFGRYPIDPTLVVTVRGLAEPAP